MGFGADVRSKTERAGAEVMSQVRPEDLLKFGLIPEFVGRLPIICSLDGLSKDALVQILTEPKNSLMKQYKKLTAKNTVPIPTNMRMPVMI